MQEQETDKNEVVDTGTEVNTDQNPNVENQNGGETWPEDSENTQADALLAEEKERYLRLYSEFDNFKKRTARERMELLLTAGKDVILSMLPVLDDMERALKAADSNHENGLNLEGFHLIHKKMTQALESKGLKAVESVGKDFDVELHEAISKVPAGDDNRGKVVDEVEKGYMLNDKVIRYAKVVVGE